MNLQKRYLYYKIEYICPYFLGLMRRILSVSYIASSLRKSKVPSCVIPQVPFKAEPNEPVPLAETQSFLQTPCL